MALVLSAFDLVVHVTDLPDGVAAFARAVPNATFCTDGTLARASFMDAGDRDRFALSLTIPPASMARADLHSFTADAPWIECGRHAGTAAVWLRGGPRDPLVVPVRWRPSDLIFNDAGEMKEHLEYLGREKDVEAYRDKRTGQKVYIGRTQPTLPPAEQERLEALRLRANELLKPFLFGQPRPGFFEKRTIKKGVGLLEEVLATVPDHWPTLWTVGMSLRALGQEDAALPRFRRAYEVSPGQPDVGREYAGQCMRLGLAEEGLRVSRELQARFPENVSLQSNLALALLIAGEVDEAVTVGQAALAREPNDPITRALVQFIGKVKTGLVPRPTRMPGM